MQNPEDLEQSATHLAQYAQLQKLRHLIFSRFDQGIESSISTLYATKPEMYALRNAKILSGNRILDLCCGIGGTSIGFARSGKRVTAVDISIERLRMAKNNARVYGVDKRIEFVCADAQSFALPSGIEGVFIDPPWGPPSELNLQKTFGWSDFCFDVKDIIRRCLEAGLDVGVSLPPNFDPIQFGQLGAAHTQKLRESIDGLPSTNVITAFFQCAK